MGRDYSGREVLAGIEAKLDRVQSHLAEIDTRGLAWVSEDKSWRIGGVLNERERRYVVTMRLVEPTPPVVTLMVDEVIHHLRSSLDHLASYLVEWSGGQVGRAAWPIVGSRLQWERKIEIRRRVWQVWRQQRGGPLAGASESVRAFVKSYQPYERGGNKRDDPLFDLNELWNAEKHRVLNPIHVYLVPGDETWRSLFSIEPSVDPIKFKWVIKPTDEMKLGTERTFARLEFPRDRPLPKVKMGGKIPAQVVVGNSKGKPGSLNEDLDLVRQIVREATGRFPPK